MVKANLCTDTDDTATVQQHQLQDVITTTPISRLNDDSLLLIFERIPPLDLVCSVQLVCRKWCELVPFATHTKKKLSIERYIDFARYEIGDTYECIPSYGYLQTNKSSYCPSEIDVEQLCYYFPRVTHLSLHNGICNSSMTKYTAALTKIQLLRKWSATLVSLSINIYTSSYCRDIVMAINNLTGIRNLVIRSNYMLNSSLDLQVLSSLHQFRLSHCHIDNVIESLKTYASVNRHLKYIEIDYRYSSYSAFRLLHQIPPNVAEKFTSLNMDHINCTEIDTKRELVRTFRYVVSTFNNISHLAIGEPALDAMFFQQNIFNFWELLRVLTSLQHLESLSIKKWNPEWDGLNENIPQFKTLKKLYLAIPFQADHTFSFPPNSYILADMFPKLEKIDFFYIAECSICELQKKWDKILLEGANYSDMEKHLRRCGLCLAKPWLISCPLLRTFDIELFCDYFGSDGMSIGDKRYTYSKCDLILLNSNDET